MVKFHEEGIGQTRKIIGYFMSLLATSMIFLSGVMKLIGSEEIMANLEKANIAEEATAIGIIEISCVIIYWIPKFSNIGFFLLSAYAGGIIAMELVMGFGDPVPWLGVIVTSMIFIGTILRKPSLSGLNI